MTHIFLIDDDQDDAELFSDALDELKMNATIVHYADGNEGLEKLKKKEIPRPNVIFLDINMPQINGWDCLRGIKDIADLQHIPIVMYSTSNFETEGITPGDV